MEEYWSRVIGVYVAVAGSSDDALKRTAAHTNAASATNAKIMILRLPLSLICFPSLWPSLEVFGLPPQ